MYRFLVLAVLLTVFEPVFAERIVTQAPLNNFYYSPQAYYGGNYAPRRYAKNRSVFYDINDLERYAMNRNFTKDSDLVRLERLETLAFGAVQEGDIYARYDDVRNAILSRPKPNYKTSFLRSLSDYFNGQLTGFTPNVTNTGSYPSGYEKNSYSEYGSPFGRGYKTNYYGYDNGAGIHILD